MPEGAPLRGNSAVLLAWPSMAAKALLYEKTLTYPEAIAAGGGEAVKRVPRSSSDCSSGGRLGGWLGVR